MFRASSRQVRITLLGAGAAALVLVVSSASAANPGDPFLLGVTNTIDVSTSLTGASSNGPQVRVKDTNSGTSAILAETTGSGGIAVYGKHSSSTGTAPAVKGESASTAANAVAVSGVLTAPTTGSGSAAVRAVNMGTTGYGVYAVQKYGGVGVFGSGGSAGVLGSNAAGTAVRAVGGGFNGVYATNASPGYAAVLGENSDKIGSGTGVEGISHNPAGIAVLGEADGPLAAGVQGENSGGGYAGRFYGGIFVDDGPLSLAVGPLTGASPSIADKPAWTVSNASPTTITDLQGGAEGQRLTLIFKDSNSTINDGGNFRLAGTFTSSPDDTLELIRAGGIWYELGRSLN